MCRNTFGGNDYLSTMAIHYTNDPKCNFLGLCGTTTAKLHVAAVANMKKVNPSMAWIEAVRTSRHYRNNGLAFTLLHSMLKDTRNSSYKKVWSCTVQQGNASSLCLQMKQLARIQMIKFDALNTLSGWAATDSKQCSQHLLQALHVEHSVSERARSMQWHTIESKKELERILANIQSKGGCGFMPGIYEVIDGQRVQNALQEGLVFSLNDLDEDAAVLVFLRDAHISSLKSNWSLSLAGVSDQHLQAALWFASSPNMQAKLAKGLGQDNVAGFTIAFDGALPSDGPLCSILPLTQDMCLVYGKTLCDSADYGG